MWPLLVAKMKVVFQTLVKLSSIFILMQEDMLVLDIAPESFYKYVVQCPSTTVHADLNIPVKQ
jgi:hypothetical protein